MVCGADGVSYSSHCLATCQNVTVAGPGECGDAAVVRAAARAVARSSRSDALARATASWQAAEGTTLSASVAAGSPSVPSATIPREAMERFSLQGFKLVGLAKEESFLPDITPDRTRAGGAAGSSIGSSGFSSAPPGLRVASLASLDASSPPGAAAAGPAAPPVSPVGATAVLKTADGFVYQLSGAAASQQLGAALAAAAASAAGDAGSLAEAIRTAAGGDRSPGFVPAHLLDPSSGGRGGSPPADAPLAAALLERMTAPGRRRKLSWIIGQDNRKERADYPGWPYSAVGQLTYNKGSCTGVMIGPRSVLTAGHCVYSRKRNAWQEKINFTPYRHRVGAAAADTWPAGRVPYAHATTYQCVSCSPWGLLPGRRKGALGGCVGSRLPAHHSAITPTNTSTPRTPPTNSTPPSSTCTTSPPQGLPQVDRLHQRPELRPGGGDPQPRCRLPNWLARHELVPPRLEGARVHGRLPGRQGLWVPLEHLVPRLR
jgi:hypothetical protein